MGDAVAGERINRPEHVTKFIIEKRPESIRRQTRTNIADLFANLVPDLSDLSLGRRVLELENNQRLTGLGITPGESKVRDFLELFFQSISNLPVNLLGGSSGPKGADDHQPQREIRVFALTQLKKS